MEEGNQRENGKPLTWGGKKGPGQGRREGIPTVREGGEVDRKPGRKKRGSYFAQTLFNTETHHHKTKKLGYEEKGRRGESSL